MADNATSALCSALGRGALRECLQNSASLQTGAASICPTDDAFWVAVVVRGQAYRLAHWIAWHLALGAARVLVYDNGHNFNLEPLQQRHLRVRVIPWPGHNGQLSAYNDAIALARREGGKSMFVGCWDIDEYLVPSTTHTMCVSGLLRQCERFLGSSMANVSCAGLRFNTMLYGGLSRRAEYLSPVQLTGSRRGKVTSEVKSLVKTGTHGRWVTPHSTIPRRGCLMDEKFVCLAPHGKGSQMPFTRPKRSVDLFGIAHFKCTTLFDWVVKRSTAGRIDESEVNPGVNACPTCRASLEVIEREYESQCGAADASKRQLPAPPLSAAAALVDEAARGMLGVT